MGLLDIVGSRGVEHQWCHRQLVNLFSSRYAAGDSLGPTQPTGELEVSRSQFFCPNSNLQLRGSPKASWAEALGRWWFGVAQKPQAAGPKQGPHGALLFGGFLGPLERPGLGRNLFANLFCLP